MAGPPPEWHVTFDSNAGVNRPPWSQWSLKREKQLPWSSIRCCQVFICTSEGIDFSSGYYSTFQPKYHNVVSWALLFWKLMRGTTVSLKCLFIYTWTELITFLVTFLYCRNTCSTYILKIDVFCWKEERKPNWKYEFRAVFMCARKLAVFWHNFLLTDDAIAARRVSWTSGLPWSVWDQDLGKHVSKASNSLFRI